VNPAKELELAKHIENMLASGVVEEAQSPWASPVVLASKKDGTYRFCVDYRRLNAVTVKDSFPIPHVQDMIDALGKGRIFTTLDVASGFWHIPIATADRPKTAFTTNSGTYQFRVLPFGLTNAPAAFCRAMTDCLKDLLWICALVFVDDIIIFSADFESHLRDVALVLDRLRNAGFLLRTEKCCFFEPTVDYLGHRIGCCTVAMNRGRWRRS
jgi:putative transposase